MTEMNMGNNQMQYGAMEMNTGMNPLNPMNPMNNPYNNGAFNGGF
jgi:hypothetical protein